MAFDAGTAYMDVLPETSSFGRSLTSDLQRQSKGLAGRMGGIGKTLGKGLAVGVSAGIAGVGVLGKLAIDAAVEAEKIAAQTQAVIKSTGGVAGITAKAVGAMSERLMNLSGVSDETIASGTNMLLTFRNIRNEVGGEFVGTLDKATMATLDMSVAMGKDMQSSAILVGKALNDPIKGLSAMSRVGIQFTESQEKAITKMVEAGDTVGAQTIILKELETQFGGSAKAAGETFGGQMDILKERVGNVLEELGFKLIPVLSKVVEWLGDHLPTAIKFGEQAFQVIGDVVAKVRGWFDGLGGATEGLSAKFGGVVAFVQEQWPKIQEIIASVVDVVMTLWRQWGDEFVAIVKRVWSFIGQIISNALDIIMGIFDVFAGLLTGDWSRVWDGIKGIVGGVWETIKDIVSNAFGVLREIFGAVLSTLREIWGNTWDTIKNTAADIVGWVLAFLTEGFRNFLAFFIVVAGGIVDAAATAFGWIPGVGDKIKDFQNKFHETTSDILEGLDRQIDKFHRWGEDSKDAVDGVITSWQDLRAEVKKGFPKMAAFSFVGGDGLGIVPSGPAGTPTAMFNALAAAVPGPQSISSGYRPGAITSSGNPSLHGIPPPWNAVDVVGANLLQFAQAAAASYGPHFRELIFTPLGYSIKNGVKVPPIAASDHFDHVHMARLGFHGEVSVPTLFLAGEAGRERVDITPQGKAGMPAATFNFYGPVFADQRQFEAAVVQAFDAAVRRYG